MQVRAGGSTGKYWRILTYEASGNGKRAGRATHLCVNLVHWCEVAGKVGEEDIALNDRGTIDPSALEDLGHVVKSGTLHDEEFIDI